MLDYEKIRTFNYKKAFDLERVKKILNIFKNPEKDLKIVHIAGTKGKSSVSFYLKDLIIKNLGLKVGLFISPHIKSPTERITINDEEINIDKMENMINYVKKISDENNINLTYFEIISVVSYLYFKEKNVDIVILETGLGGRLDATNVANPILSIITRIDKDHTNILGKTLFKIGYEKLGILKKGTPFIIGSQKIYLYPYIFMYTVAKKLWKNWIRYRIKKRRVDNNKIEFYNKIFKIKFEGPKYSIENFHTALKSFIFLFGEESIRIGKYKHNFQGRFEEYTINKNYKIIFDGAHNKVSIQRLVKSIKEKYQNKFAVIFNCQIDKDYKKMLRILKKIGNKFIIPEIENMATEKITSFLKKSKTEYITKKIDDIVLSPDNYLITGSFYIIEPIKKLFIDNFKNNFEKY